MIYPDASDELVSYCRTEDEVWRVLGFVRGSEHPFNTVAATATKLQQRSASGMGETSDEQGDNEALPELAEGGRFDCAFERALLVGAAGPAGTGKHIALRGSHPL
jgi:hypothetical protein